MSEEFNHGTYTLAYAEVEIEEKITSLKKEREKTSSAYTALKEEVIPTKGEKKRYETKISRLTNEINMLTAELNRLKELRLSRSQYTLKSAKNIMAVDIKEKESRETLASYFDSNPDADLEEAKRNTTSFKSTLDNENFIEKKVDKSLSAQNKYATAIANAQAKKSYYVERKNEGIKLHKKRLVNSSLRKINKLDERIKKLNEKYQNSLAIQKR